MSNIRDSFKSAGLLEKIHLSFTYPPAGAHTVALLDNSWSTPHFFSFWWSSHGTGLSKLMEFSVSGLCFHQNLSLALLMVLRLNFSPYTFDCCWVCTFTKDHAWSLKVLTFRCSLWLLIAPYTSTIWIIFILPSWVASFCVMILFNNVVLLFVFFIIKSDFSYSQIITSYHSFFLHSLLSVQAFFFLQKEQAPRDINLTQPNKLQKE